MISGWNSFPFFDFYAGAESDRRLPRQLLRRTSVCGEGLADLAFRIVYLDPEQRLPVPLREAA